MKRDKEPLKVIVESAPERQGPLALLWQLMGDIVASIKGCFFLIIFGGGVLIVIGVIIAGREIKKEELADATNTTAAEMTSVTPMTPVTLPDLVQKSHADVMAVYGQPVSADKATGWAVWSRFKARFVAGRCAEVGEREP